MRFHLPNVLGGFRAKVKAGLVEQGMTQEEADNVVGKIGDGTLLQWIITHGPDIAAFIASIIALFPK
jgi:hypothetical protein